MKAGQGAPVRPLHQTARPGQMDLFYLYTILDIYSRYVPGWLLARAERA